MAHPVTTDKFWPFPKIADMAAQDQDGKHWRSVADDYLGALVGDFWRGRFPQVFHSSIGIWNNKPDSVTREVVWNMLGFAKPRAFRDIREGEYLNWEEIAKARPEDYGSGLSPPGIRNTILAQLLLPEAKARDWIRSQGKAKRPVGRPAKYEWDAFWRKVVQIANTPDGLPEKQAELEKRMLEWCGETWGGEPAESVIREKLAPLYAEDQAGK